MRSHFPFRSRNASSSSTTRSRSGSGFRIGGSGYTPGMLDLLRWLGNALPDQRGGVGGTVLAVVIVIGIVIAAVIALLVPND